MSDSFAIPWTISHQVPLSTGFPRQQYWSGSPFPPPEDFPDPRTEASSPALAGGFLIAESQRRPLQSNYPPSKKIFQMPRKELRSDQTNNFICDAFLPKLQMLFVVLLF